MKLIICIFAQTISTVCCASATDSKNIGIHQRSLLTDLFKILFNEHRDDFANVVIDSFRLDQSYGYNTTLTNFENTNLDNCVSFGGILSTTIDVLDMSLASGSAQTEFLEFYNYTDGIKGLSLNGNGSGKMSFTMLQMVATNVIFAIEVPIRLIDYDMQIFNVDSTQWELQGLDNAAQQSEILSKLFYDYVNANVKDAFNNHKEWIIEYFNRVINILEPPTPAPTTTTTATTENYHAVNFQDRKSHV